MVLGYDSMIGRMFVMNVWTSQTSPTDLTITWSKFRVPRMITYKYNSGNWKNVICQNDVMWK
jgi:hypothetical protein